MATKSSGKSPSAKKSAKKKAAPKKKAGATAKKAAKKAPAKKAPAKKAPAKKAAAKKPPATKASTKKAASKKKSAAKKASAKAAPAVSAPPTLAAAAEFGLVPEQDKKLPPIKIAKRDLTAIEKALRGIRAQLTQDVDALTQNNLAHSSREMSGDLSGYGFHMADVATDNFAREMELNIATNETDRLRLTEEAMERLQDGTFGRCLVCGDHVGVPRLKVMPYARFCIRCAEEVERS